jgi:hypothetical protein
MRALRLASASAFVAIIAACGGTLSVGVDKSGASGEGDGGSGAADGGGGAADGGKRCTTDAECGSGFACGFARDEACTATGTCFDIQGIVTCAAYSPGCACDGTEINVGCSPLPTGYVSKPLLHAGACSGGAADGGKPCTSQGECPTGFMCGFSEAAGCSATTGVCLDTSGRAVCNMVAPGCACDGTMIGIGCTTPLPEGYSTKPLRHPGQCAADGG